MELGTLLFLLLVLACPLAMIWMLRGAHGGRGHASHESGHGCGHAHEKTTGADSVAELRRRRVELDAEIARLEELVSGTEKSTPA